MKKILIVLGVCSVILACNSAEKTESTEDTTAAVEQVAVDTSTAPANAPVRISTPTPR